MRYSTKTMVGLQPDSEAPFPLAEGRRSGLRRKSTIQIVNSRLRYVAPQQPKPMSNADAQCFCFGAICLAMAVLLWLTT